MSEHGGAVPDGAVDSGIRRRPSLVLLVAGLAALAVSVGAGLGLGRSVSQAFDVDGRWIVVVVALVVGGLLVTGPRRRRGRSGR